VTRGRGGGGKQDASAGSDGGGAGERGRCVQEWERAAAGDGEVKGGGGVYLGE
jgi:hypothetical protein